MILRAPQLDKNHQPLPPLVFLMISLLLLTGCGGGSSDSQPAADGTNDNELTSLNVTDDRSDADGDLINDMQDNCPTVANPNQLDSDSDMLGDACDDAQSDVDVIGSAFYSTENNSAILTGPVVGDGTDPNSTLRRELSITGPASTRIEAKRAYLTRGDRFSDRLIVVLQNNSSEIFCFIEIEGVVLTDATGSPGVGTVSSDSFATGSIGNSTFLTSTCLAPNEKGYVFSRVRDTNFDRIAAIEISDISVSFTESLVDVKIIPTQYTLNDEGLSLTIQNQSAVSATVSDLYDFVVLDESGLPLDAGFGFLSLGSESDIVLAPGEEFTATDNITEFFTGSASTIRFILDLERPTD